MKIRLKLPLVRSLYPWTKFVAFLVVRPARAYEFQKETALKLLHSSRERGGERERERGGETQGRWRFWDSVAFEGKKGFPLGGGHAWVVLFGIFCFLKQNEKDGKRKGGNEFGVGRVERERLGLGINWVEDLK